MKLIEIFKRLSFSDHRFPFHLLQLKKKIKNDSSLLKEDVAYNNRHVELSIVTSLRKEIRIKLLNGGALL